jgi:hypothetical protein
MNINIATEILELNHASSASPELSYDPVWISTDRRQPDPTKTSLKYSQVGGPSSADKIGNGNGPIFRVEFVDLASVSATHIKVWALDNDDAINSDGVLYPISYIAGKTLDIWLKKFEFTDSDGDTVAAGGSYLIYGHRKRQYPVTL